MKNWLLLGGAILSEAAGSLSLKAALESPAWYIVVAVGFASAFAFLSLLLREGMALGVAYGIWAASGVVLTAVLSSLIFGESVTPLMVAGMVLIALGVLMVEFGAQRASSEKEAT